MYEEMMTIGLWRAVIEGAIADSDVQIITINHY